MFVDWPENSSFVVMFVYVASICIACLYRKFCQNMYIIYGKKLLKAMNFEYLNPQNIFRSKAIMGMLGVSHVLLFHFEIDITDVQQQFILLHRKNIPHVPIFPYIYTISRLFLQKNEIIYSVYKFGLWQIDDLLYIEQFIR